MVLVAVCDQNTSKFFVLSERIHGRTCGCKWSLLKVRKEKYKGEHGWPGGAWGQRICFCSSSVFKSMERGEPGESHPIISEYGGTWEFPSQVRAVPEPKHG
jgi:hypothetical protein